MYTIYTANVNGDEVEQGHYVDIVGGFSEARRIVETKGDFCDGLYDCFMIKDYLIYWLLKPNEGRWDYFYSFGAPLVVSDDDLTISSSTTPIKRSSKKPRRRLATAATRLSTMRIKRWISLKLVTVPKSVLMEQAWPVWVTAFRITVLATLISGLIPMISGRGILTSLIYSDATDPHLRSEGKQ